MTSPQHPRDGSPSFTSTPTFRERLLASECSRFELSAISYVVMLLGWFARWALGGSVSSAPVLFALVASVLIVAIGVNLVGVRHVRRLRREGGRMRAWQLNAGISFDVGVPLALLSILHVLSPRGPHDALTAPSLLLLPLTIMLSTLRLRPRVCVTLGVASAIGHWVLVASTAFRGELRAHPHELPLLLTYGVILLVIGFAAAEVARLFRQTIREAVSEAQDAERTAAALRGVERELDIARSIQQGLLPSEPPGLARFDVAGMSRPATQTGGDFYDWQPLPDGRCVVAIADVTGHGIGPALVMAVCRAYARAITPTARSAGDLLDTVNELISTDLTGGRFITMAVAVASPEGVVELISAGHGPTFVWRAGTGTIERFDGQGIPLGLMRGEKYAPIQSLALNPGDAIILLTDGFMEHPSPSGERFGIPRLEEVIRANSRADAAALIRALDDAVRRFADGREQDDDMTAVVLRHV